MQVKLPIVPEGTNSAASRPNISAARSWRRLKALIDGKKVARVNKPEAREIIEVPHLRIVDDALWARAKARQSVVRIEMGRDTHCNALNRVHRRQFLLSGLLICACCGGAYTITGKDRYACATRRSKGTCSNALVINRQQLEAGS